MSKNKIKKNKPRKTYIGAYLDPFGFPCCVNCGKDKEGFTPLYFDSETNELIIDDSFMEIISRSMNGGIHLNFR